MLKNIFTVMRFDWIYTLIAVNMCTLSYQVKPILSFSVVAWLVIAVMDVL